MGRNHPFAGSKAALAPTRVALPSAMDAVLAARAAAVKMGEVAKKVAKRDEPHALTTSLHARHALVNHAQLPVMCVAYAPRRAQLLVADHRELRLYSGTQQVRCAPLPTTAHGSALQTVHYNARGDQFVFVYPSSEVRIVGSDLVVQEGAALATKQMAILSSAWLEHRQELVTAGSDGSLKYFLTQRHFTVELKGRRTVSKFVPRMTIRSEWRWMAHMCADEIEDRLFVANEREVLVWHSASGELLQRLPSLHDADVRPSHASPGCAAAVMVGARRAAPP